MTTASLISTIVEKDLIFLMIGILLGLVSWGLKELWMQHRQLDAQVNSLEKRLPVEFTSKDDLKETKQLIGEAETRLNKKIDHMETTVFGKVDALRSDLTAWFNEIVQKLEREQ